MEAHLLTASILHCPEVQALVPLNVLWYPTPYPSIFLLPSQRCTCAQKQPSECLRPWLQPGLSHLWTPANWQWGMGGSPFYPAPHIVALCPGDSKMVSGPQGHATASSAWALPAQHWLLPLRSTYPRKKQYVSSRVQGCSSKGSGSLLWLFLERKLGITTQVLGQDSGAPHPVWYKTSHIKTVLS